MNTTKRRISASVTLACLAGACASTTTNPHQTTTAVDESQVSGSSAYDQYHVMRGDLHVHSSTGSFDAMGSDGRPYRTAAEQLALVRQAGLDFVALTEHDVSLATGEVTSEAQWRSVAQAAEEERARGLIVIIGYEWTPQNVACIPAQGSTHPDHKIVLGAFRSGALCPASSVRTLDSLGACARENGGMIIAPHPWTVVALSDHHAIAHAHFAYSIEFDDVFVGAEVSSPFAPIRWTPECGVDDPNVVETQTNTLDAWRAALAEGKHVGAVLSSDSHGAGFDAVFGNRSTIALVRERSENGVLEALRSRRTFSVNGAPFDVRFSVDGHVVGETVRQARTVRIDLPTDQLDGLDRVELWNANRLVHTWQRPTLESGSAVHRLGPGETGALWVMVVGTDVDATSTMQRATVSSPIWIVE